MRPNRITLTLPFAVWVLYTAACSSTPPVTPCADPLIPCGESCVDPRNDPANCGACGTACGAGELCIAGQCESRCGPGTTLCGSVCVDTDLDPSNCGACGTACAQGQVCNGAGQCALTCQSGWVACDGACVDPSSNLSYCGASADCQGANAGTDCEPGHTCSSGQCVLSCQSGLVACDGTCVDPNTSNAYCGASGDCAGANAGTACEPGFVCDGAGQCALSCQSGLLACDGTCVDPQTDNAHCGATGDCTGPNAGTACAPGTVCDGMGQCALSCQAGLIACNGTCVDPLTSDAFCGATGDCVGPNAGSACAPGHMCDGAGQCALSCQAGLIACGGVCVDPLTSNAFCGAAGDCAGPNAGVACAPGTVCSAGGCEVTCQSGLINCGGTCVDPATSNAFCGATGDCAGPNAGTACASGHLCTGGLCELSCQSGLLACNGKCVDPDSDPAFCGATGDCLGVNDGTACPNGQACLAGQCQPVVPQSFLLNRHNAQQQHVWNPVTNMVSALSTIQANDVDCHAAQGSPRVWYGEHINDRFGRFVHGTTNTVEASFQTPYAYPKHVAVFANSVYVMSRNDATIKRYDFNGVETGSLATGNGVGQGLATDGAFLYASFWNGTNSFFVRYTAALGSPTTIPNPTGLGFTNVVDFAYHPATGRFLGMVAHGESGTGTNSTTIVEFTMGGAAGASHTLPFPIDGIGRNACP